MKDKRKEKYLRIRYLREIERFINSTVNFLNTEKELTKDKFASFVDKKLERLNKCEKVILSKGYPSEMENFVEKIVSCSKSEEDTQEIKSYILYEANRLRKTKRLRSYRKEKYKKIDFDEY